MNKSASINLNRQKGVGLIDVMVAIFIFSVGLLAISALQFISKQSNYEAIQRTNASVLAYDILERMRMNSSGYVSTVSQSSLAYYTSTSPILNHTDTVTNSPPNDITDCSKTAECSPEELADWDIYEWTLMLLGGTETDKEDSTKNLGGLFEPTACITGPAAAPGTGQSGIYTISIAWRGQTKLTETAVTSGNSCGDGIYGTDNEYRRLLQIQAYLDSD